MTPTRLASLFGTALIAALLTYAVFGWRYSSLPPVPATAAVSTSGLAVAELFLALGTRARLDGRPGTKPILPLTVARIAALAKASSTLGGLLAGVWLGIGAYVLPRWELASPRRDAIRAGVGLASALLLVVAALRLENVCRVPPPPPEAEPGP
ncbi:MAG TPA: DUF3180 domain-containing protein [Mycobacteriales bacterium]|jgi:hypothetical protein